MHKHAETFVHGSFLSQKVAINTYVKLIYIISMYRYIICYLVLQESVNSFYLELRLGKKKGKKIKRFVSDTFGKKAKWSAISSSFFFF